MRKLTALLSLVFVLCLGLISFDAKSGLCIQTGSDVDNCYKIKAGIGDFTIIYLECLSFPPFNQEATWTGDKCTKIPE